MRSFHVCTIAVAAAVAGSLSTLGAQKQMQRSTVFEWASLEAKPTQTGIRRDVMRAPTPTLDELEIHITTLNPGQVSHPPHQHPEEELLIVREGTVETLQNGKASQLGPGSNHLPLVERPAQHPQRRLDAGDVSRRSVARRAGGQIAEVTASVRYTARAGESGGRTRILRSRARSTRWCGRARTAGPAPDPAGETRA